MRYIELVMIDKSVWRIPAGFIAKMRAEYYATKDTDIEKTEKGLLEDEYRILWTKNYNSEYEYTLGDDDELLDWLENNCDWSDFAEVIVNVIPPTVDYSKIWSEAEKKVVERQQI